MRRSQKAKIALLFCAAAGSLRAQTFKDLQRYCLDRADRDLGIHWIEECIQTLFTDDPFHLTATVVAPGSGIAAFGPGFGLIPRVGHFEFLVTGFAAVSTDGSTIGLAQLNLALPTRGLAQLDKTRPSNQQRYGLETAGVSSEGEPVDVRAALTLRARRINARAQDFYGLGPDTALSGYSSYGLQLTELYAGFDNPLSSWSSAGFDASVLAPRVTSAVSAGPPLLQEYNRQSAPGLTARDNFVRYEPYLILRLPPRRSLYTRLRAGYAIYQALGDPQYSFRRITVASRTTIPLLVPSHNTSSHRPWIANTLCPSLRSATRCSLGTVTLSGDVTASYTATNRQVPFYFDPTLGGEDIDDNDTLRGFRDYRFRGPSSLLLQAEYLHPIWGPVGWLSFYDVGNVALRAGDLSLAGLRHDIGVGLYLHAGNRELVRFYVGFGSGEGARFSPKLPIAY